MKITTETESHRTKIRVDGELIEEGVEELRRVCTQVTGPVTLELSNLDRIDGAGILLLRDLEANGAELARMTPYIALRLRRESNGEKSPGKFSG